MHKKKKLNISMESLIASFEKEIRTRLNQKSTSFVSEEQILMKNFKYFDLDNSGRVDFQEFIKSFAYSL